PVLAHTAPEMPRFTHTAPELPSLAQTDPELRVQPALAVRPAPPLPPPPTSATLGKMLMLQRQARHAAGVIEARPRTPMEMTATATTMRPDLSSHWVRLVGISIATWILVLALFVVISYD